MKIKNFLLITILNVVVLFSACSGGSSGTNDTSQERDISKSNYSEGSAEYTVDSFLTEFKANNIAAMRNYMVGGIFTLDENSSAQNDTVKYTWDTITQNFEYEILSCEIKNDEARVTVNMKNISLADIMRDTYEEFNTKEVSRKSDAKEDVIIAEFYPILKKYTENYTDKEKIEKTVTIALLKSDDKWEIVNDSEVFDAMTGGYIFFILRELESYVVLENGEGNQNTDGEVKVN